MLWLFVLPYGTDIPQGSFPAGMHGNGVSKVILTVGTTFRWTVQKAAHLQQNSPIWKSKSWSPTTDWFPHFFIKETIPDIPSQITGTYGQTNRLTLRHITIYWS